MACAGMRNGILHVNCIDNTRYCLDKMGGAHCQTDEDPIIYSKWPMWPNQLLKVMTLDIF